jgi:hypothetical protein
LKFSITTSVITKTPGQLKVRPCRPHTDYDTVCHRILAAAGLRTNGSPRRLGHRINRTCERFPHSRAGAPAPRDPIQLLKSQNGREKLAPGFDGALLLSLH